MKLEQQVCNLELAKKLKELGIEQKSEFVWIDRHINITETTECNMVILWKDVLSEWEPECDIIASAFTATELLEMLPEDISYNETIYEIHFFKTFNQWYIEYNNNIRQVDKNLCNALAKMLIYLIENKLINNKE